MFSIGLVPWREWRMTGLLRGFMLVATQWINHGLLKEKMVWMSGKQGEWCMIIVYGRGL